MATVMDTQPGRIGAQPGQGQPYSYYKYASATAAAVMSTAFLPKMIGDARFKLTISASETITVQGSKNGTNFDVLNPINEATGNKLASTNLVAGVYKLPLKSFGHYRMFKFVGSGTADTKTVLFTVALPYQTV